MKACVAALLALSVLCGVCSAFKFVYVPCDSNRFQMLLPHPKSSTFRPVCAGRKAQTFLFWGRGKDDEGLRRKKYCTSLCSLLPLHPHQQHISSSSSHPPPVDHLRKTQILTHALPCTPRPRAGPWRSGRSFPQRMTTRSDV
jgi:hypothetical protein